MKYRVSSAERWGFWEIYSLVKNDVVIDLEFSCKTGSVIVDADQGHDFGDEFDSEDYKSNEIEDTGDEELVDWDIFGLSDEEEAALREELDAGYDSDSEDYYDFREYLEFIGWEFQNYKIRIPAITVEEYTE